MGKCRRWSGSVITSHGGLGETLMSSLDRLLDLLTVKTGGFLRSTNTSQDNFPEKDSEEEGDGSLTWYFSMLFLFL